MEKERAAERAASQKAAVPTDKADDSGKAGKRGIPQGLAGRLVAARTVLADKMEADTGVPPAVVEMVTGPLAGYRLQGNIQKHDSSLTVMMDTLFYNGQQIPVKALLISPETQEATVASSVDHQYLARIGIPALVGGAQGLGQAAQQSGSSFAAGPYGGAASYSQFSPWQIAATMAGGAAQGVASTLHSVLPQGSIVTLKADEMVNVYFQDEVYLPPQ
jgi:intracellular multiplication protein IcmE